MKGMSFGNSPLEQGDQHFDVTGDGVTGKDVETKEEREARYTKFTYTPSVAEVLRTRKGEKSPPPPKDPIHKFLYRHLPK